MSRMDVEVFCNWLSDPAVFELRETFDEAYISEHQFEQISFIESLS